PRDAGLGTIRAVGLIAPQAMRFAARRSPTGNSALLRLCFSTKGLPMTIKAATPYLILNGRAARAVAFYERSLAASTVSLQRFGDVDGSCPEAKRDLVMHAELRIGDVPLLLSDGPGNAPLPQGGAVNIALDLDDVVQARRIFDALAHGGTVVQALMDAPWGAL